MSLKTKSDQKFINIPSRSRNAAHVVSRRQDRQGLFGANFELEKAARSVHLVVVEERVVKAIL
jgi:hypothetical protein